MYGNVYKNMETQRLINKKLLHSLYIINKESSVSIAKKFNCSHVTIIKYLRKYNISVRNKSESSLGIKKSKWNNKSKENSSNAQINLFKNYHERLTIKYNKLWSKLPNIYWAWIAGFWEGEGGISYRYRQFSKRAEVIIHITQKDSSALEYIKKILHTGKIYKTRSGKFNCHKYLITKSALGRLFIKNIIPYLKSNTSFKKINKLEIK
jgi:hypothetical protein